MATKTPGSIILNFTLYFNPKMRLYSRIAVFACYLNELRVNKLATGWQ